MSASPAYRIDIEAPAGAFAVGRYLTFWTETHAEARLVWTLVVDAVQAAWPDRSPAVSGTIRRTADAAPLNVLSATDEPDDFS